MTATIIFDFLGLTTSMKAESRCQLDYMKLTLEKTYHCENFGRKSLLLTMEQFFVKIRYYAMEWCHHKKMNKEGCLN